MISCLDVQQAYNCLYIQVRKYLWDYAAVEALANLEVACYQAFPDLQSVSNALSRFKYYAYFVCQEDEDLDKAFVAFEDLLHNNNDTFMKLHKVNEVIRDENQEKQDSEIF